MATLREEVSSSSYYLFAAKETPFVASISRAVITLTNPPDNRWNTTNAKRPASVSPRAM
jgi:hypothetical protein